MLLFIHVQHNLLYNINQLNLGFLKISNKNDARILQKRVNARAGKSRDFVANTKLWYIGARKRVTFVLLVRKSEKFIDEEKNDTKNYTRRLWCCPPAPLSACDDNFPTIFPLLTSTLSPHARESGKFLLLESGNLGFRIRLRIRIWNPKTRNPVPEIRNPWRRIQNPSLSWIPLLRARNRKIIEKSFNSESHWLIRPSLLAIKFKQPTDACIDNIQEKVSLS